jgi:hypothetical protein
MLLGRKAGERKESLFSHRIAGFERGALGKKCTVPPILQSSAVWTSQWKGRFELFPNNKTREKETRKFIDGKSRKITSFFEIV